MTNNMAEYEALSKDLDLAKVMKPRKLSIHIDSQLLISQVSSQFEVKEEKMAEYQKRVQKQLERMRMEGIEVKVAQVPREENHKVDMVAILVASQTVDMLMNVIV